MNPAFTGLTYEHRLAAIYRNQWPGISTGWSGYMASYDYNSSELHSGFGGTIIQDRAGTPALVTFKASLNYAYVLQLNKYSDLRGGLSFGMAQKKIDNTVLVFNDQLITGASMSQDARNTQAINYSDLGAGLLYNSLEFWAGASAQHLNNPNISLTGGNEILNRLYNIHGGYRFILEAHGPGKNKLVEYVSLSVQYRHQQNFDQLDFGAYYFKSFFILGAYYRGLPFKKTPNNHGNRESVVLMGGLEKPDKGWRIAYSYDITISTMQIRNTLGAHEISLVYEIAKKKKRTRRVLVSCPKF